jgi:hypothetical protein
VASIKSFPEDDLRIHKVFATAKKRGKHFGKHLSPTVLSPTAGNPANRCRERSLATVRIRFPALLCSEIEQSSLRTPRGGAMMKVHSKHWQSRYLSIGAPSLS